LRLLRYTSPARRDNQILHNFFNDEMQIMLGEVQESIAKNLFSAEISEAA
jgi:hypothetical protein